ncbi:MAG TPA: TonB-dependent receptor [Sphingobium sp.]|uniref:TonB-dependent receptor n=1 Tax=Sphingobium sp. TaxID=1912891 RepID=UPI002ED3DAFD
MFKKFHSISILSSASLVALATAATPAIAQDASVSGDIVVTARRVEERLQDVPISISVFSQQQLSNRNVVNSQDLARYTPSLSANSNFGNENSTFALRGFVQDTGTAPSVGVYFADVVAPRGASNNIPVGDGAGPGAFFDLANVQVLKGPQGTLQGRNTTGGAVLLVPQKPTGRFEGYVEGSIGNYGMKRVQAVVNIPVMDTLRIRVGVDRQTRDGYIHNNSGVGPADFGDVDYTALRFSAVADLTPNLENYTIISYSKSHTNGTFQKLVAVDPNHAFGGAAGNQLATQGPGFYDAWSNERDPYSKIEQWQIINTTTWQAGDNLTFKNIVSYAELRDYLQSALFGTNLNAGNLSPFLPATSFAFASSNPVPGGATGAQSTFTEEFQVQGRAFDDKLTYQGGAYLEVSNPLGLSGSQSPVYASCTNVAAMICAGALPNPAAVVNYTVAKTSFRDVGLYAQSTYKFSDQLKLTGGFRYTWDKVTTNSQLVTYSGYSLGVPGAPTTVGCTNPDSTNAAGVTIGTFNPLTDCRVNLQQKSSAPTWMIDLDYTPTTDLLLYAKYSRGYRTGNVSPTVPTQFNYIQPERVDTYEVGAKTSFASFVKGTFNVAAFYNNFANQQLQLDFLASGVAGAPSVSPTTSPVNAGKSRIWGIEVDASITPFHGFTIDGSYAHLDTKIKSIQTFTVDPVATGFAVAGQAQVGDPLLLSPKNKFTVTGTYQLPLDESIGKISVGATFVHSDSALGNYSSRFYQGCAAINPLAGCNALTSPAVAAQFQSLSYLPATNLVNLNASWNSIAGSPVDLSLFATNVTKEKYYTFLPGITGTGLAVASLGEPRMYGMRLKVRFGG